MQRIESVKEFLLCCLLAGNELNVVQQKKVHAAVALAEGAGCSITNGGDQLVRKSLGRRVADDAASLLDHLVADRLEQVRLPHTNAAVDDERIVDFARL